MDISKIAFENLKDNITTKSFEELDIDKDNLISENDLSLATNNALKAEIQKVLNNSVADSENQFDEINFNGLDEIVSDDNNIDILKENANNLTLSANSIENNINAAKNLSDSILTDKERKTKEYEEVIKKLEEKQEEYQKLSEEATRQSEDDNKNYQVKYDEFIENIGENYANGKYGVKSFDEVLATELKVFNLTINSEYSSKLNQLSQDIIVLTSNANSLQKQINRLTTNYKASAANLNSLSETYNIIADKQNEAIKNINSAKGVSNMQNAANVSKNNITKQITPIYDTIADADKIDWNALYVDGLGYNINNMRSMKSSEIHDALGDNEYEKFLNIRNSGAYFSSQLITGADSMKYLLKGGRNLIISDDTTSLEDCYKWDIDGNGFFSESEYELITSASEKITDFAIQLSHKDPYNKAYSFYSVDDFKTAISNKQFGEYNDIVQRALIVYTKKLDNLTQKSAKKHYTKSPINTLLDEIKMQFFNSILEKNGGTTKTGHKSVINGQQVVITKDAICNSEDAKIMHNYLKENPKANLFDIAENLTKQHGGNIYDAYDLEAIQKRFGKVELARDWDGNIIQPPHNIHQYYEYKNSTGETSVIKLTLHCGACYEQEYFDHILKPMYLLGEISKNELMNLASEIGIYNLDF